MRLAVRWPTVLVLALLLTLAVPGSPAGAQSGATEDTVDRVPPALDLRFLAVANRERRLQAELGLGRFDPRRTSAYLVVEGTGPARRTAFVVGWTSVRGETPGRVFARITDEGVDRVRCRGLQVRPAAHRLSVTVPQRCLGDAAGRVWVSALTEDRGARDADDVTRFPLRRG